MNLIQQLEIYRVRYRDRISLQLKLMLRHHLHLTINILGWAMYWRIRNRYSRFNIREEVHLRNICQHSDSIEIENELMNRKCKDCYEKWKQI